MWQYYSSELAQRAQNIDKFDAITSTTLNKNIWHLMRSWSVEISAVDWQSSARHINQGPRRSPYSAREKLSPATYWGQLISAWSQASREVKKQRASHLPAYTTKRTLVETFSVFGHKTRNELAHVFNSHSRQGDENTFFAKHNGVIHQQWLRSTIPQMTLSAVSDCGRCYAWECRQEIGCWKGTWLKSSRMKCRVIMLFICCWSKYLATSKLWSEK